MLGNAQKPNKRKNMKSNIKNQVSFTALAAMVGVLAIATPSINAEEAAPAAEEAAETQFPEWIQKEVDKVSAAVPGLTAEQKTKIGEAFKIRTEGLAAVKEAGGTTEETKEVWSVYVRTVKTIVTPEQFVKFQEMMKPKAAPTPAPAAE